MTRYDSSLIYLKVSKQNPLRVIFPINFIISIENGTINVIPIDGYKFPSLSMSPNLGGGLFTNL